MEDPGVLTIEALISADEVLAHPEWEPCELVRGKVIAMSPAGAWHGSVAAKIITKLSVFNEIHQLGEVFSSETGFIAARNPDTVPAPDAMFLSKKRMPSEGISSAYLSVVPDLAVEVISPSETVFDAGKKAEEYLVAGVAMVWVVDPRARSARVFHSGRAMLELNESQTLSGEEILPGFQLALKSIF